MHISQLYYCHNINIALVSLRMPISSTVTRRRLVRLVLTSSPWRIIVVGYLMVLIQLAELW